MIIQRISSQIKMINCGRRFKKNQWKGVQFSFSFCECSYVKHILQPPQVISWTKPPCSFFKINTDGASRGNPGKSGGGGILRSDQRALVFAFGNYFGIDNSLNAEINALLSRLQYCKNGGYSNVIVETDSALLLNLLRSRKGRWSCAHSLAKIRRGKNKKGYISLVSFHFIVCL
ncbi:hypothetical protein LIER_01080 [Lithospermum erythrorhizon]|uniref:RNase H type-1 domain-containing protein n=1 Tax=Lithospermum erythrorhizon TaxID=34254 RepID=A0AAV3NKV4_LITER